MRKMSVERQYYWTLATHRYCRSMVDAMCTVMRSPFADYVNGRTK